MREEQLPELARGYLPVKRDEFQRLLEAWNREPLTGQPPRIQQSDWWARWDRQQFTAGRFRLRVESRNRESNWLSLEPCRWPLREVTWQGDNDSSSSSNSSAEKMPLAVSIGVADQAQDNAEENVREVAAKPDTGTIKGVGSGVGLAIAGAGELRGSWSWRGRELGPGVWQFEADLPAGAWQRLWLDLPADFRLEADNSLGEVLIDRVDPQARDVGATLPKGWDLPAVESPQWQR